MNTLNNTSTHNLLQSTNSSLYKVLIVSTIILVLSMLATNSYAQTKYVGVWDKGSGSNLITPPLRWSKFLKKGEELTKKGLRLDDFEVVKKGIRIRYIGSWKSGRGNNIITKGLSWTKFLEKGKELTGKGYRLWDFETFIQNRKRVYVGNWRSGTGNNIITKGLTWNKFLQKGNELTSKGFRLSDFEVYKKDNSYRYAGNWRTGTGSNIINKALRLRAFIRKDKALVRKGLRLYDVEIIKVGSVAKYVGAWRKGSAKRVITPGLSWNAFISRGKSLTTAGFRLTDFETFRSADRPRPSGPTPSPSGSTDFPKIPNYIKLSGNNSTRIIVDFTNMLESQPTITIPEWTLPNLPRFNDKIIFPNNFCGLRIFKISRFIWLDAFGQVFTNSPYNTVPESETMQGFFQNGETFYLGGIDFSGPVGKCKNSNSQWMFPFPYTQTQTVMPQPLKLVIELKENSKVEFLNFKIKPGKPLDYDKLFKEFDFNKMIKFFKETFYDGFKQWVDVMCEQNPKDCPLKDKDK